MGNLDLEIFRYKCDLIYSFQACKGCVSNVCICEGSKGVSVSKDILKLYIYTPFEEEGVYRSHCVSLSGCLSVGSHILSGLFLTNHLVEFNNILHEPSLPRGDVHILQGVTIACCFT